MAANRPQTTRTRRRAPSVVIAFRTLGRTLRHGYDNLGTLIISSIFWYLGAILILPLGVATAALHRVTKPMSEERAPNWRTFFSTWRADLRWSSVLTAILIFGALLIQSNIRFYAAAGAAPLQVLAILFGTFLLLWLGIMLYAFPLALRQEDARLRTTLRNAAVMVVANAPGVLVSLMLLLIVVIVFTLLPPLFIFIPGFVALWGEENARLLLVASGYIPPDEIADRARGQPPKDDFSRRRDRKR